MISLHCNVSGKETNATAIDPLVDPIYCDRSLLFPCNHYLHPTKPHHHVELQHLAALAMTLARSALILGRYPNDINGAAGGMHDCCVCVVCVLCVWCVVCCVAGVVGLRVTQINNTHSEEARASNICMGS